MPLGSVVMRLDGSKPMSTTFLFRLISNLVSAKVVADEKALMNGGVPIAFPEFISFQMVAFYGVKSLATRYLQEMYVGLDRKRAHHPRLALFARALQVFEGDVLTTEAFSLTLQYLAVLLMLMELEKLVTKATDFNFEKSRI